MHGIAGLITTTTWQCILTLTAKKRKPWSRFLRVFLRLMTSGAFKTVTAFVMPDMCRQLSDTLSDLAQRFFAVFNFVLTALKIRNLLHVPTSVENN